MPRLVSGTNRGVVPPLEARNADRAPAQHILPAWRFFAMLELAGKREALAVGIDAIEDPRERARVRARVEHSREYDPADPLAAQLAEAVGLTGDELAALWAEAAEL